MPRNSFLTHSFLEQSLHKRVWAKHPSLWSGSTKLESYVCEPKGGFGCSAETATHLLLAVWQTAMLMAHEPVIQRKKLAQEAALSISLIVLSCIRVHLYPGEGDELKWHISEKRRINPECHICYMGQGGKTLSLKKKSLEKRTPFMKTVLVFL